MKTILILLIVAAILLCGCQHARQPDATAKEPVTTPSPLETAPEVDPNGQLLCLVETAEEAEEVATLYGITLISHADGLAVYHTEEDPQEVIFRGEENSWPELTLNYIANTY